MKATINREPFVKSLSLVSKAVAPSPVIPLLGMIYMESTNGASRLAATNLEIGISHKVELEGEEFKICLPARVLTQLFGVLNGESVEMEVDEKDLSTTIMSDTSTSNLKCISAEEFPDIPTVSRVDISLQVALFKEMIERVSFTTSEDEGSVLSGVLLKIEGKKLIAFATNGQHLSYEETSQIKTKLKEGKAVVRGKTMDVISQILPEEGEIQIQLEENKILFHCNNIDIVSQIVTGEFPDHKMIESSISDPTTTVVFSTVELLRACRQLKVFSSDTGMSKMTINGVLINYSVLKSERGETDTNILAKKTGEDVVLGISVHYLNQLLEICKTGKVIMELKGNKKPIVFRMDGHESFYHIIMPISF